MLIICIMLFVTANVLLDYSFTIFHNSAFYISESLLFSTYWILFIPFLMLQLRWVKQTDQLFLKLIYTSLATVFHLFAYPALVWLLSELFYTHTFSYWQTFNFGLSAYFIKSVIIYGFSLLAFTPFIKKNKILPLTEALEETHETVEEEMQGSEEKIEKKKSIDAILIADSNNKKLLLQVNDILYFSTNSPYINIHHPAKKYLHSETLKALESKLDENRFVRIHKSYIVNLSTIVSIQSRQNGDYDITLTDDAVLRVSRNYAKYFKQNIAILSFRSS
ncbi:MAG: LytTR family transcriptional regulator [Chitinophagaceae bacterium]|nr:MAG: LytTR family transcriptional regulator [Chitinophagaceae bacterium]